LGGERTFTSWSKADIVQAMADEEHIAQDRDAFLRANPHLREFLAFLPSFNSESQRGGVLIACSFVDEQLRRMLQAFLRDTPEVDKLLEGYNAPLGTFSSRITAAYCMGLISDAEHEDCNILRKIRNEFAHRVDITLDDPKLIALSNRLHHSAKPYGEVTVSPEGAVGSAAIGLIMNLTNRAHYVGQKRLSVVSWPR
jgi:hypothetical protein